MQQPSRTPSLAAQRVRPDQPEALAVLNNLSLVQEKGLMDRVLGICVAAQRNGCDDLSGKEIQARYELVHGQRIEAGSISARVNSLVSAGRLYRLRVSRLCSCTGRAIYPVRVPLTQARLVD